MSAGHLRRDRTEVLPERAQKTALLRRKRLHRFDCGGSAKSASGLCTRLLPVVLHTRSGRSHKCRHSFRSFRSAIPQAESLLNEKRGIQIAINHRCAERTITSALHRRREQIGRRRERPSFTRSLRALAPVSPLLPLFSRCIRAGIRPEASCSRGLTGRDTEEIVRFPSPAAGIPWRMRNKTLYLLRLTDF